MRSTRLTTVLSAAVFISLPAARGMAQVKVTTSTGEVSVFTQKNLVDHLIVGDSIEVEMAQLAASRTQNTAVRDYANMLLTDHKAHLENLRKIAAEHDVGRQASASDTSNIEGIRALTSLRAMAADSGFDNAFIRGQIEDHKKDIVAIKMFGGAAKDDDLKEDIKHTMPLLERHLARAREVAAQLGLPSDTTGTPGAASTTTKKPNE